ncbi:hypothetical protein IMG5_163250 [Ichthyophthirius multifiliis]|uniref:Palmitoyltransferase n=1 Tax=Ichthyophthirius multifiliis TaxID=5932 RepID=G0R0B6_ICHMU|nr:hypothetical protein IMG5_163250 [Ichthyophthirius multifiliis]EGR29094.1 hypothetical protein IMG5_163250 [Ichthyophthirius multifiliis]|eukprot:XP_004030330.1 hypothetical protein IMG5_163250 [Ichthyophthirius multifiliis]
MLLWSMTRTIISDPGKVPTYWGVIMDDPESKKRRYCLICHQFKPERSHHCSTCQRCVLNMDHHCPWIMNCIGYQNRKFFILMIFYITLTVFFIVLVELLELIQFFENYKNIRFDVNTILKIIGFTTSVFFLGVISNFFKFHIQLLMTNSTTIETMDKQRQEQQGQIVVNKQNPFDLGYKYNFYQVFGLNPLLWPLPMFAQSGNPYGDGVIWEKKQTEQNTQEENN